MTIQVELQWVIGFAVSIALSSIAAFWTLAKILIAQSQKHIDAQFRTIQETLKTHGDRNLDVERQLMQLKAELPQKYVMRDDHVRVQASLQVAIDALRQSLDRWITERSKP